jgi:dienelactone hydrolase
MHNVAAPASLSAIHRRFRQDVQLASWRQPGPACADRPEPTGAQRPLFEYLIRLARRNEQQHARIMAGLATRANLLRRGAKVRRVLWQVQGLDPWPVRTPLQARVRGGFAEDGFRVEHVVLESRPGFFVTANLYLPTTCPPPFPAVLFCCGHSLNGKAYPAYQRIAGNLTRLGLATLLFDPVGQGERDEYVDVATGRRTVPRACRAHDAAGMPAYLLGANFGGFRLWDAMRCVDYLQSRHEIDPARIGATGTSGGGWESLWLAAIDPRIRAVHANCYFTTWRRRMEERAADAEPDPEQDPFGLLTQGLEASDLIVACAPRAVSIGGTTRDFFPLDGLRAASREARLAFEQAGLGDRFALTVSEGGHGTTAASRTQIYRWLSRWLKGTDLPAGHDPEAPVVSEKRTWCTKTGIVLTSLGGRVVGEWNAAEAQRLARTRRHLTSAALRRRLAALLDVTMPSGMPRVTRGAPQKTEDGEAILSRHGVALPHCENAVSFQVLSSGMTVTPLRFQVAGRPAFTGHLWLPTGTGPHPGAIVIREKPADFSVQKDTFCRRLAKSGVAALDLDPAGMGPLQEKWLDFVPLIESALAYDALLLGRTLAGLRTADVLAAVAWLARQPEVDSGRLAVYGRGAAALPALCATSLDPRIGRAVEDAPLVRLASLAENRDYAWNINMVVPGMLRHFDLPDLRAALAPRRLLVMAPRDHRNRPVATRRRPAEIHGAAAEGRNMVEFLAWKT